MTAPARPNAAENICPGSLRQIQIEDYEIRTRQSLLIEAQDKVYRPFAIRDENQFAFNGMLLQSFTHEPRIGRVIFDQEDGFFLPGWL